MLNFGYSQHRPGRQGRERPGHEPASLTTSKPLGPWVKAVHQKDLEEGFGEVYLPFDRTPDGSGGDSARPVLRPAGASVPFLSQRNGGNLSWE